MVNRDWFCLALRLFGIWLLIQSIEQFVPYLLFTISAIGPAQGFAYAVYHVIWLIGRSLIGLVLLIFAPAIAARFYPSTKSTETTHFDDEARPLKVGIQLLAVYALLLAIQSASGVIIGFLSGNGFSVAQNINFRGAGSGYLASLLTFGLNLAFAAILIIWNERVVSFLARLRYVPDRDAYEPPPLNK